MIYEGLKTAARTNLSKLFCLFILSGSLLLGGCYTQLAFSFDESESDDGTTTDNISNLPVAYPGYPDPWPPPAPIQYPPSPERPIRPVHGGTVQNPPGPAHTSKSSRQPRSQDTRTSSPSDSGGRKAGNKRTGC